MRGIVTLITLLLGVQAASAGDASRASIIGFSTDGRMFAFEQYGIQDGSGFPYSEIFIIDLDTDSWLPGTPVRQRLEDEMASLKEAREMALAKAKPLLAASSISETGQILAANPPTEIVADRHRIVFDHAYWGTTPAPGPREYRDEVVLTENAFPVPTNCPLEPGTALAGFRLSITQTLSGSTTELHNDANVPASRGCALGYDIDSVIALDDPRGPQRFVALIGVYSLGFEGNDRRLIAVPVRLP